MAGMILVVCSLLLGIISAKSAENDPDYRQLQTPGGNSYPNPSLSGGYASQGTYSAYPIGYAIPQPIQPVHMNSYATPFGLQGLGGGFGLPAYSGFPNLFG